MGTWKTCVFNEKLKMLKEKIREWNKEVFGHMDLKIQNTVEEPNVLDELACSGSPQDLGRRKELLSQFW